MGGVKDKYLFRECTGDQYVDRCACGLNQLEQIFAVSPDYFYYSKYDDLGQIRVKKVIKIPSLYVFCKHFFHNRHLDEVTGERCSFMASILLKYVTDELLKFTRISYP